MADPLPFLGANTKLNPAPGDEEKVRMLPSHMSEHGVISRWRLTPEELAAVNLTGGDLWLQMPIRSHVPPVYVSGFPLIQSTDPLTEYDPDAEAGDFPVVMMSAFHRPVCDPS